MAPRLSGQTSGFGVVFFVFKSLLGIAGQKQLEKFAILARKPGCHVKIMIYRTWPIPAKSLLWKVYNGSVNNLRHLMCLKTVFFLFLDF